MVFTCADAGLLEIPPVRHPVLRMEANIVPQMRRHVWRAGCELHVADCTGQAAHMGEEPLHTNGTGRIAGHTPGCIESHFCFRNHCGFRPLVQVLEKKDAIRLKCRKVVQGFGMVLNSPAGAAGSGTAGQAPRRLWYASQNAPVRRAAIGVMLRCSVMCRLHSLVLRTRALYARDSDLPSANASACRSCWLLWRVGNSWVIWAGLAGSPPASSREGGADVAIQ